MSFSTFSKEFNANMFTCVENQFITKYLPQADGDAVRAYLYGLYLCGCAEEFDAESAAKLLRITPKRLADIFSFWEECDLVHVLSRDPLFVEYLPVNAAVGKPKPIRPEKYAEFNRAFYTLLQRANKDFRPYEMQRILEFLEKEPMEQQAFLLVAEYCAKKDGSRLSAAHILNKAEQLCRARKYTYEQVEEDLADFNEHERELSRLFTLLGISRKPQEADYAFLEKWRAKGVAAGAVQAAAAAMGKGTLPALDGLVDELCEKEATGEDSAREYMKRRAEIASTVFKVARKLGVKVQNPRPYAEEYCEKWLERGYDDDSLSLLASLCLKLGYGFEEMDSLIGKLYADGIVDEGGVRAYCASRDRELRLLQKIQNLCGVVKKSQSALDMIAAWRSWNFSEEMILEAAARSANASSPLPYMNKLLSEWKRLGAMSPEQIPAKERVAPEFKSEAAVAADMRADRERHYSELRARAVQRAERAKAQAERDGKFREADAAIRRTEIELAKAELYAPETVSSLRSRMEKIRRERSEALRSIGLTDSDLVPAYSCPKCSDTGYLPDGKMCDCYQIPRN